MGIIAAIININSITRPELVIPLCSSVSKYSIEGTSSLEKLIILERIVAQITRDWLISNNAPIDKINRFDRENPNYRQITDLLIPLYVKEITIPVGSNIVGFHVCIVNTNLHLLLHSSQVRNN